MERYGQYRDRASGIAPFFPIPSPATSPLWLPWHLILFSLRVPLLATAWIIWLTLIQFLPAGSPLRKANQWCLLGIPGVWWVDIQIDGVRRGSIYKRFERMPRGGCVVAAGWTTPLDVLYLAAIFDPIFTQSYADGKLVRPLTQESALAACLDITNPLTLLTGHEPLTTLSDLLAKNPSRVIVVFPEGTPSNGRAILRLTPSLASAGEETRVYPVSVRYSPMDIATPIPGWLEVLRFIWRLNSSQSHTIRVRVGGAITAGSRPVFTNNGLGDGGADSGATTTARQAAADRASLATSDSSPATTPNRTPRRGGFESNYFDTLQRSPEQQAVDARPGGDDARAAGVELEQGEQRMLDEVADNLARLGRVKRVDLGVEEKEKFVQAWKGGNRRGKR